MENKKLLRNSGKWKLNHVDILINSFIFIKIRRTCIWFYLQLVFNACFRESELVKTYDNSSSKANVVLQCQLSVFDLALISFTSQLPAKLAALS